MGLPSENFRIENSGKPVIFLAGERGEINRLCVHKGDLKYLCPVRQAKNPFTSVLRAKFVNLSFFGGFGRAWI